jgi:hypothetical protein
VSYEFPICKHRNPPGEGLTSGVVTITGVPDMSCHACALERRDEQIRVLREAIRIVLDCGDIPACRQCKGIARRALAATEPKP